MANKKKSDLLEQAKKRFKAAAEADIRQRKREHEDLKFQVPEFQWDEDAKRSRMGTAAAGVPIPARPMLSISLLDQPTQLILNQERSAHLGINIHPLSEDATDETAEKIQGLYRQIERDSQAGIARSWAFARAVLCGRGAYRVNTKFDEAGAHPFDQVISIDRLLYQDAVYFDPSAQKPDKSDAEYAFITEWVPIDRFKALYPKAEISKADDFSFAELIRQMPEWVKGDGETKAVLVAEYWYKEYEDQTFVALKNGTAIEKEEVTENDEVDPEMSERIKKVCTVEWCKLTAGEILEEQEWNGHYIPIIPVIGRELQPFSAERYYSGIIGPAKDSQRLFNYAVSTATEIAALEPKSPWIAAEGSFDGHESEWKQANIRNFPYLEYKPVLAHGGPAPPPARTPIDASKLGVSLQLMQLAKDGIQNTTQTFDPSLGQLPAKDRSGKAIMALQQQSDAGNSHYLHNMADISMSYEARVVLDLIPAIYDRPKRLARILDEEDESETVMLNQPHIIDPQSKRALPVIPGVPLPPASPTQGSGLAEVKHYDLRKGVYGVDVTIGKSWQTRLEQGSEEIGQILQAQPNLMPIIGPLYFRFRDFPGATEIADLLKKVREKQFPGLDDDVTGVPSPEAAAAQLQGAKQQIQELQQQLQMAAQEIKTEQAKQQAMLQKTQMEIQSREKIAMEANTIKLLIEKMDTMSKMLDSAILRGHEKTAQALEHAHEVGTQVMDQSHAATMALPPFTAPNPQSLGSEEGI